jgi:catechol 2,3-dioxygenase-like lactoylglutathione lyase family enzyme
MVRLRLPLILHALVLTAGVALAALLAAGARAGEPGSIERVDAIGITVSDMDRALAFYTGVLPFEVVSETEVDGEAYEHLFGVFGLRARIVRLRLGAEEIELIDYLAPEGRPIPEGSRSNDAWFQHVAIIVSDMDAAYAELRRHKVQHASSGPQTLPDWNPNAGGIKAFYFKDPDGNHLEILEFPEGKGDPRWQSEDALFLGIDHTAIVVGDTDGSLAFYRDRLGLEVAGESENWGPEQERLNNVFGARLRITALRAPKGPGIELLEYLAPSDGRPFPEGTRANDLWHWQVNLVTANLAAAAAPLRAGRDALVSPGAVELPENGLGFHAGLMARDPDGHALMLIERPQ